MLNFVTAVVRLKALAPLREHPRTGRPWLKMTATNIGNNSSNEDETIEISVCKDFAANLSESLTIGDCLLIQGYFSILCKGPSQFIILKADRIYKLQDVMSA